MEGRKQEGKITPSDEPEERSLFKSALHTQLCPRAPGRGSAERQSMSHR